MNWIKKHPNISLFSASLVFAFIVAEILLRLVTPTQRVLSDPILGVRGNPDSNYYDDAGFRNEEVLTSAHIVAIGDSQTEGNNADTSRAWPQRLGVLSDKTIYQMAVGGYSAPQYRYLIDKALKLDPELILVAFYAGNDTLETYNIVYDNNYWQKYRTGERIKEPILDVPDLRNQLAHGRTEGSLSYNFLRLRQWLRSKSKLYTLVGKGTRSIREKLNISETKVERNERIENWLGKESDLALIFPQEGIKTLLSPVYRLDSVDLDNPFAREGMNITRVMYGEIINVAKEENIQIAFVIIPTKEMVYGQYAMENEIELRDDMVSFISKEIELKREVFDICIATGTLCIDVLPGLVRSLEANNYTYPRELDGHPTPIGYQAIADTVYDSLNKAKLL